jgi:enoyl-[acyl-carrier protein] reductase II
LTAVVRRLIELEQQGAAVADLLAVRGRDRARRGCVEGEIDEGLLPAGSAVGLVRAVQPVAEVIEELVAGCAAALAGLGATEDDGRDGQGERRSAA